MEITYKLHGSQYQIYRDPTRFIVLAAGRRYGKTVLAIVKMLTKACEKDKALVWYIAPTYRQAKMIAWKMLSEMIPERLIRKKNEVELEINLINGSSICLKGADNEDSLRGAGLDFVVLDEFAIMRPNVWDEIIRPMLTDRQAPALFIGTPSGKNHFWELWMRGIRNEPNYSSYRIPTEANPYIPRSEIKDAQSQMSPLYFRQEYLASFEDFAGLVWPEFSLKTHVIDPFPIPKDWTIIGAIDPAITGITGVIFSAIDYKGNLFVFDEIREADKRVGEICSLIQSRAPANYWLIDPASKGLKTITDGRVYTLFDEYRDHGITPFAGENDVDAGINRVAEYFQNGKIKIFSTCEKLIWELERYHWAGEAQGRGGILKAVPFKMNDHLCDALRYLIMSRPIMSEREHEIQIYTEKYFEKIEEEQKAFEERLVTL